MNPQIEIIVDDIAKNLTNTVFFVGAGISRRSGLPLFWEINQQILLQTTQTAPEKLVSLRPEILLQLIQNELGNNVLSFLKIFRDKHFKPNSNHYLLAHIIKHRGYVITTNWDDLIEQACNNINAPFKVIHTPKDFEDFVNDKIKSNANCGYIFKMHGDIEEKDGNFSYESIQMTIGDIECGLDKNKSEFLDMVKAKKNFCFMGYSGMDDFDIIPEMRKKSIDGSFYWLQHNEETTQKQITKLKAELENWKKITQKQGVPIKTKLALTDNISHWVVDYVKEHEIDLLIVDYPKLSMEEITLFDDIINVIHHKSHCHLLTTKPLIIVQNNRKITGKPIKFYDVFDQL